MKRGLTLCTVLLLALLASGCVERVVYVRPSPPPLPREEIITIAPSPTAVWVPGRWHWRRGIRAYVWVPGHWRLY